ncbi:hypothetical protein FAI40_04655 [Acetobacteraceae bacterium]|nr:hypothetical protein FAI40_04655 [Acetobacteraceae bacterium]
MKTAEVKKKLSFFFAIQMILGLVFLAGLGMPMKSFAQVSADFVPPDTHILARLKGNWVFHYQPSQQEGEPAAPSLRFEQGENVVEVTLIHTMDDFLNSDDPIEARNYFKASISDFYFDCNGGNIILWFDNGDSAESAPSSCQGDQVQGSMLTSGAMPDEEKTAQKKFALEVMHYRPVAISQGQYSLMLDAESENGSWQRFARANNPKTNPGYFESVKKYFLTPKNEAPV